jgi:3-hydroxyisobutyrate dehydrogenase
VSTTPVGGPASDDGTAVGVIGLGAMGLPMAARLVQHGYAVVGCDPSAAAQDAARAAGITVVPTARQLGERTGLSLLVVGDDDQLLAALDGANGLLGGAAPGHLVLVAATVAPETSLKAAELAAAQDVAVMDAALVRGEQPARDGTLLILCGGAVADVERARPVLDVLASDVHRVGGVGAGQVAKMLNNYLLWASVVADYEALRLGARMGLDLDGLRAALVQSSGASWALETWLRPRPMPWAEADMEILLASAEQHGLAMPAAAVVRDLITAVKQEKRRTIPEDPRASMDELVRRLEGVPARPA